MLLQVVSSLNNSQTAFFFEKHNLSPFFKMSSATKQKAQLLAVQEAHLAKKQAKQEEHPPDGGAGVERRGRAEGT